MSTHREGPNPLRPYYIPPSIGLPSDASNGNNITYSGTSGKSAPASTYASSARDIFADIDYSDYVSDGSQSTLDMIKEILDQALYKYMSVLLAQPFEVAKTILQVRSPVARDGTLPQADVEDLRENPSTYRDSMYSDHHSDDSDPDEPAYFTSSAPYSTSYSPSRSQRRHVTDRAGYVLPPASSSPAPHQLVLKRSDSIMEVISQLWSKEGAWGVWKGSNATFIYSVMFKTTENWSRSLLAALVNVPDPGMISGLGLPADMVDSPYPWASLALSVGAALVSALLLAPLDIVRTKLIITSTSTLKRRGGLLHEFKNLPSFICPPSLYIPTFLHCIISPIITHATPLLLRSRFGIDQILTPAAFSIATFLSSTLELFVKLPLETVLRRAQMSLLMSQGHIRSSKELDTIVDVGPYRGVVGTMWSIVREEGVYSGQEVAPVTGRARAAKKARKGGERKGQGVEGLWRGWRVGMWGLVGMWSAAAMGSGSVADGEF